MADPNEPGGEAPLDPPVDVEPDYRFTLANERTFLAWIRTAVGLLAGGVVLDQATAVLDVSSTARTLIAAACIVLAGWLSISGYRRWEAVQAAMRAERPLPHHRGVGMLAGLVVLLAIGALVLVSL